MSSTLTTSMRCRPWWLRKWRDRFIAEGVSGLEDRSSRPHHSPSPARRRCVKKVVHLRTHRRGGPAHIAKEVGAAPSTIQRILARESPGRLNHGDRATPVPLQRYQRGRSGELLHVDVKKLGRIPDGGGWRIHVRQVSGRNAMRDARVQGREHHSYLYIHTALDDRSRLAYSEILNNERAATAAAF